MSLEYMALDKIEPGEVIGDRIWKRFRADMKRRDLRSRLTHMRRHGLQREYRWALRDVSVHIEPGESVGLIGPNGSGKSTLLKILADVMDPYAGRRAAGGRIGALIGVKAGIHPELTGRENVYLYGTLLGLARARVAERFDEIVDFAGLAESIDRQVKFYSSGMKMRLGFAVAAFLEPDLLIVDEALAVGDATFQQQCLDRMRAVQAQGTTLIFVSHDLAAVENSCERGIWLRNGTVEANGDMVSVMAAYRQWIDDASSGALPEDTEIELKSVRASAPGGPAQTYGPFDVELEFRAPVARQAKVCIGISEGPATPTVLVARPMEISEGDNGIRIRFNQLPLPHGRYVVWAGVFDRATDLFPWHPVSSFDLAGPKLDRPPSGIVRLAPVHVDAEWERMAG